MNVFITPAVPLENGTSPSLTLNEYTNRYDDEAIDTTSAFVTRESSLKLLVPKYASLNELPTDSVVDPSGTSA